MIPRVLTIAGSDSSGGAGIQADLKTFTVFRAYGMSAVTALTAQNTLGVAGILPISPEFVRQQIDAVATDVGIDAAKTGMLANQGIIAAVCEAVRVHQIERLVVDPVMIAQSGAPLLDSDAHRSLMEELLPLATVVTPNAPEAAALLDMEVATIGDMREAARRLVAAGARAAVVKGGHIAGPEAVDILCDSHQCQELRCARVLTAHTHGTGCMTAAAITVGLAEGLSIFDAAARAKRFITAALANSLPLGSGSGPANPLAWLDTDKAAASRPKERR